VNPTLQWCPPCRAFTPTLIKAYNDAKAAGANFELVFVSSDEDVEGFDDYTKDMPWLAVKFDDEEARSQIGQRDETTDQQRRRTHSC